MYVYCWLVFLPVEENKRFHEEITEYEEVKKMPYITTAERIGMEKGIEEGKKKGEIKKAQCDVVDVLETRFEAVPRHLVKEIKGIEEIAVLSSLHRKAVLVKNLDDFAQIMNKMLS